MSGSLRFVVPEVLDSDIRWASRLLGLPDSAFYGKDGADSRQEIIKFMEKVDVAACPGSGKTTLLVAKLAILGQKWLPRTRGVCVLSHTNAARHEIESRLGCSSAGHRLLAYPHFIGTIHGFINEFLAMPWLRSLGYPIKMVDTEICEVRRWGKLDHNLRFALQKKHVGPSDLEILDPSFAFAKKKGGIPLAEHTDTYKKYRESCRATALEGYHCYDDMFMWSMDLLEKHPDLVSVLRDRFPLLFIDEAQDNSEIQSAILHRIFVAGGRPVIRQRFGDGNQAIFGFIGAKEATMDKFPDSGVKKDIRNSHRFGQRIADLADPLGIAPYGLVGQGPHGPLDSGAQDGEHTIFLFDANSAGLVLDAYGALLIRTFSERELRDGTFTAVGQVHKPQEEDHGTKQPHHIGHYWYEYDPQLGRRDPTPRSFSQYVLAGQGRALLAGESHPAVEKMAQGILRLVGMAASGIDIRPRQNSHRHLVGLFGNRSDLQDRYHELIETFALKRKVLTEEEWKDKWSAVVRAIGAGAAGCDLTGPEIDEFLAWQDQPGDKKGARARSPRRDNVYRFPHPEPKVNIRIGSIHSIKGETHTATLVCETYWYKHNLETLLPWISGSRAGWKNSDRERQQNRMKVQYVAMTRPTNLLCLAMKKETFQGDNGSLDEALLQAVCARGWRIQLVE